MTICCNAESIVIWFGDYMTINLNFQFQNGIEETKLRQHDQFLYTWRQRQLCCDRNSNCKMISPEATAQYQRHENVESIPPKIDELQPNIDRRKITKITDFQREREVRSTFMIPKFGFF